MFEQSCFIRKISKDLKQKLERLGLSIIVVTDWSNSNYCLLVMDGYVYGSSYDKVALENIEEFLKKHSEVIDCGINEELFLSIAALQNDNDNYQWFVSENHRWYLSCTDKFIDTYASIELDMKTGTKWHKATVEELINHFK